MRRSIARRGTRATGSNVVALIPPPSPTNTTIDIEKTFAARELLPTLLATLATQRQDASNTALRAFAADLAAVQNTPGRAFVDTQYGKFTVWKTADDELAKRIDALEAIRIGIENRIGVFEKTNKGEVVQLLTRQIAVLEEELQKQGGDEDALKRRIKALQDELVRVESAEAKSPAAAKSPTATKKAKN